jgi:hypothetical protein
MDEVEGVLFKCPKPFHVFDFEFAVWWYPGQLALGWHMASCCWLWGDELGAQENYHCGCTGAISIPRT